MKTTTTRTTKLVKADADSVVTQDAAARWWCWAVATAERLADSANRLAREVNRNGSPLRGLFDGPRLREFANQLEADYGLS